MEIRAGQVAVHAVEHGTGRPVLVLHGAGVDHREAEECFEPALDGVAGLRRVYPDLPGMGRTIAPETVRSADDVLDTLLAVADEVTGGAGRRRSPVWRWSVHCCRECATSRSTTSSSARATSGTTCSGATS